MPALGGVEFAKRVRIERGHLPVVLLSGFTHFATGQPRDAYGWIVERPCSVNELLNAVRSVMRESGRIERAAARGRAVHHVTTRRSTLKAE